MRLSPSLASAATLVLLTACSVGGSPAPAPLPPPPIIQPSSSADTTVPLVNPPPSAQAPAPQPKPRDVSVTIQNFAFSPATLRISKGTTVTWTNGDAAPHRIDANGAFPGSPSLATGQSYSYTFDEVGTFSYICSIHPSMKGTVEVVP